MSKCGSAHAGSAAYWAIATNRDTEHYVRWPVRDSAEAAISDVRMTCEKDVPPDEFARVKKDDEVTFLIACDYPRTRDVRVGMEVGSGWATPPRLKEAVAPIARDGVHISASERSSSGCACPRRAAYLSALRRRQLVGAAACRSSRRRPDRSVGPAALTVDMDGIDCAANG